MHPIAGCSQHVRLPPPWPKHTPTTHPTWDGGIATAPPSGGPLSERSSPETAPIWKRLATRHRSGPAPATSSASRSASSRGRSWASTVSSDLRPPDRHAAALGELISSGTLGSAMANSFATYGVGVLMALLSVRWRPPPCPLRTHPHRVRAVHHGVVRGPDGCADPVPARLLGLQLLAQVDHRRLVRLLPRCCDTQRGAQSMHRSCST